MSESNWTTVTQKKRKPKDPNRPKIEEPEKEKYDNDVVILRKRTGPPTKQVTAASQSSKVTSVGVSTKKLDQNVDGGTHKKVELSTGQLFQKALNAKKWSQKDLLIAVGGKSGVNAQYIQQFAAGKALFDNNKIGAIEKALNIKLRGKNVGEVYFKPKSTKGNK